MTQSSQFLIALDVGGGSVKSGRVNLAEGQVTDLRVDAVDSYGDAEMILGALAGAILAHVPGSGQSRWEQIEGVALGFPGPFDYAQGICYISTPGVSYTSQKTKFASIYGVNIRAALRERLGQPALDIRFRNDAEAAILGEAIYGAGRAYSRVIGVTLGTGFGSAFLVDGVPQTDGPGVPEHGWLYPMPADKTTTETADDAFSTRGLLKRLHAAGLNFPDVKAAAIAARAPGQTNLAALFAQWGADLGGFMAPWLRGFAAQAFLMVGGIAQAHDLFGPALAAQLPVPALSGTLGPAAPLLGAANLFQHGST